MIDVKQAISSAREYAQNILGTPDLLLEEVRSSDDSFEITFSFPERIEGHGVAQFGRPRVNHAREYKNFDVDKESGQVTGMSIREIA
jgi:hypothetical protein